MRIQKYPLFFFNWIYWTFLSVSPAPNPNINAVLEPVDCKKNKLFLGVFLNDFLPVPKACTSITNLRNPSGVYLKTACLVPTGRTYDSTRLYCTDNQMELFTIDSNEVQKAIIALANSQYGSGWLWFEGKNATGCSALRRTGSSTSFYPTVVSCNNLFYSYCGYKSKIFLHTLEPN